jgi:4a-hydroxytetrahydrobiopterin dehydratase
MTDWRQENNALVRELHLRDFDEALGLVQRVAARAVDYGRRPDVSIEAGRVRLSIANRHNAGITEAERRLAAKVDAVIDAQ